MASGHLGNKEIRIPHLLTSHSWHGRLPGRQREPGIHTQRPGPSCTHLTALTLNFLISK